jgi:hypothetical protein
MASQKVYVGNGKKRSGTWLKINLDVEKILANAYTSQKNGKKYINLDVNIKDEKDGYGNDVSVAVDGFVPNSQGTSRNVPPPPSAASAPAASAPASAGFNDDVADDLPF